LYIDTSKLPQLNDLAKVDDDVTDARYGFNPYQRPVPSLLDYGLTLIDKPSGPTSHEVVAWIKKILQIAKAGHSGTLDPSATGLLPVGLGEGTKALSILLLGPKEYYAVARLHSNVVDDVVERVTRDFACQVYQRPPQRSSVRRATRIRTIYQCDKIERQDRLILLRVICQAGTYIRKLVYDIGEVLGPGATMVELRRTMVSNLCEKKDGLVKLHDLSDAFQIYRQNGDDTKLRNLVKPIEECLQGIRAGIVRDTAVDAVCHGAPLAVPGVIAVPKDLKRGELLGIYTIKGEIIGLAEAAMTRDEIEVNGKGIAFNVKRIIMKPGTYPKRWHSGAKDKAKSDQLSIY
jgi:H/ACA ribonucleoprotein complex subunit 4